MPGSTFLRMRQVTLAAIVGGILLIAGAVAVPRLVSTHPAAAASRSSQSQSWPLPATRIELRDLLDDGPTLRPSKKALALRGKRVHLVGFMVEMEQPIRGGFYLAPRPISLDESGAGTGDLPPDSVLVLVPGGEERIIPHLTGALEGIGTLEVGNQSDAEGRVSNFRLRLDPDRRVGPPSTVARL